jgi:8-oxo-dGTP pyrophosphatase MutT (NUDIX family)
LEIVPLINASGGIFLALNTNRICLQLRSDECSYPGTWSFWGGKSEENETPVETLIREIQEEAGDVPEILKVYPLHKYTSRDKNFIYNSFVLTVKDEFIPVLNAESDGYAWTSLDHLPKPLHLGVKNILKSKTVLKKLDTIMISNKSTV